MEKRLAENERQAAVWMDCGPKQLVGFRRRSLSGGINKYLIGAMVLIVGVGL